MPIYDEQDEAKRDPNAVRYVNVFAVTRTYGGPEEGGWWFDEGEPVASVPVTSEEEQEAAIKRLETLFPNTGKRHSVLGGDDHVIYVEDEFAQIFPAERPRYS